MLELVDLDRQIGKEEYQQSFPALEARLGRCQRAAHAAGLPVLIVFEGWDAAGKGTIINRLTQALDPRGFKVYATSAPNETERFYPWMWRFWQRAPRAGNMTLFDRSWYGRVLFERVNGLVSGAEVQRIFEDIEDFERQLADDGTVILKFWMHIGKGEQKRRFKRLEKDQATAWKVGPEEWNHHRQYGRYAEAVEEMLERTGAAHAPWTVVESTHKRFARTKVFETIAMAIERELERRATLPRPAAAKPMAAPKAAARSASTILSRADLTLSLDRETYKAELDRLQPQLLALEHRLYAARLPAIIVFQGEDAAGKGGIIKRLTLGLDPRGYEVVPTGPPSTVEKAHHWLWRFWAAVPKAGHVTIFDRSWYGRVLVERVEGFCTESQWQRAYREINEFERQLADFGAAIVKFYVVIDAEEQLRRFEERRNNPEKCWKLCDEDWRNRKKRPQYDVAAVDMLEQTSTPHAPWTILEANCKLYARIKALKTVAEALEAALKNR